MPMSVSDIHTAYLGSPDMLLDASDEASQFHFPNSCSRSHVPVRGVDEYIVDWTELRQQAWEFVDTPLTPNSVAAICPSWSKATACECECGDCMKHFLECPIGTWFYRIVGMFCQSEGATDREQRIIFRKWGRGFMNMPGKLKNGFAYILQSGWPIFGILAQLSVQTRIDGHSEVGWAGAIHSNMGRGDAGPNATICGVHGWHEDPEFRALLGASLLTGECLSLEQTVQAGVSEACPLQAAAVNAAIADSLLCIAHRQSIHGDWLSSADLLKVEHAARGVELKIFDWVGRDTWFFEFLVTEWPIWELLHRVGRRLLTAFMLNCKSLAPEDYESRVSTMGYFCPACDCPIQGEWAVEGRYITEYAERLSESLSRCVLPSSRCMIRKETIASNGGSGCLDCVVPELHLSRIGGRKWERLLPPLRPRALRRFFPTYRKQREAFATVLFVLNAQPDQVILHVEAIRTLAFSARRFSEPALLPGYRPCTEYRVCSRPSARSRPFVVLTDGALPEDAAAALDKDGISVVVVDQKDLLQHAWGANEGVENWWLERGVAPTSLKLAIWNMTSYDRVVFLDADTLVLAPIDELFELDIFASGVNPYSLIHGSLGRMYVGINTGVMVLQPSTSVFTQMMGQMRSGRHTRSAISDYLGQSDQPWLDAFWLHYSSRLGLARFSSPLRERASTRTLGAVGAAQAGNSRFRGCSSQFSAGKGWDLGQGFFDHPADETLVRPRDSKEAHCLLPLEYDFFVDYKSIRTHIYSEERQHTRTQDASGSSSASAQKQNPLTFAGEQHLENGLLSRGGLKILHWPGELRKPWQRYRRAARSVWDDAWWKVYRQMCRWSTAPCVLRCQQ